MSGQTRCALKLPKSEDNNTESTLLEITTKKKKKTPIVNLWAGVHRMFYSHLTILRAPSWFINPQNDP